MPIYSFLAGWLLGEDIPSPYFFVLVATLSGECEQQQRAYVGTHRPASQLFSPGFSCLPHQTIFFMPFGTDLLMCTKNKKEKAIVDFYNGMEKRSKKKTFFP